MSKEEEMIDQYISWIRDLEDEVEYFEREIEYWKNYYENTARTVRDLQFTVKYQKQMNIGLLNRLIEFRKRIEFELDELI